MDLPQKSNYRDPRPLISCVSCVSCNSWIAVYVAKERSTNCTKHTKYHEISEAAFSGGHPTAIETYTGTVGRVSYDGKFIFRNRSWNRGSLRKGSNRGSIFR